MNIEEVKEHFKDAKEVRCLRNGKTYKMSNMTDRGIYRSGATGDYWFSIKGRNGFYHRKVWDEDKGFAEIISYKGESYHRN